MRLGASIVICFVTVTSLVALQSGRSPLSGVVVDAGDAVLPGVSISIRGPETRSTTTDRDGQFKLANLPHGDYEITASLAGYGSAVQQVSIVENTKPITIRFKPVRTVEILFIDR